MSEVVKKLSLVTLMGLPASGKTTLSDRLRSLFVDRADTLCVIVRYDDLVPLDIQKEFLRKNQLAKIVRKNFLQCVDWLATSLVGLKMDTPELGSTFLPDANELYHQENLRVKTEELWNSVSKAEIPYEIGYLIVDDNNYYTSMRNELYQIAKKLQCSFCVLYLKSDLELSRKRNSSRPAHVQVPNEVIGEMSKRLEEPNPMENACDLFCVQITENISDDHRDESVKVLLQHSIMNPVVYKPPPDGSEDRRICSQSELHQADLVLRKWISSQMITFSFSNPPSARKEFSKNLAFRKSTVLQKLKTGELKILARVSQDIEFHKEVVGFANAIDCSTM